MIRFLSVFSFITLILVSCLYSDVPQKRIAVSSMVDNSLVSISGNSMFSESMEKKLKQSSAFEIRNKNAVKNYLNKLEQAQLGLISEKGLHKISAKLKIDYLLVGTLYKTGSGYNIQSRLVDPNTWKVVLGYSFNCNGKTAGQDKICDSITADFPKLSDLSKNENSNNNGVVVYGFQNENNDALKKQLSSQFEDFITTQLSKYKDLSVVEHLYSNMVSKEKEMEMAGVISNETEERSFQIARSNYLVSGTIRNIGDMICINWFIKGRKASKAFYYSYEELPSGSSIDKFSKKVAVTVESLIVKRPGSIEFDILPADTEIFANGMKLENSINCYSLDSGKYSLKFEREGYISKNIKLNLKPGQSQKYKIRMRKEGTEKIPARSDDSNNDNVKKAGWEKKIWDAYDERNK